jgi:hypothetical protein
LYLYLYKFVHDEVGGARRFAAGGDCDDLRLRSNRGCGGGGGGKLSVCSGNCADDKFWSLF